MAKKKTTRKKATQVDRTAKAKAKAELFAGAYLANGQNATQAAITAGYSAKTAKQAGHRLLTNVDVAQILARHAAEALHSAQLTAEGVLHQVACIVQADPRKLVDADGKAIALQKLDDVTARAIASVEFDENGKPTKVRFWDKNAAAGHAMRYLGLVKPDTPLLPPPPQPPQIINAHTVTVNVSPLEAYQRMLAAPKQAIEGVVTKRRAA